MAIAQLKNPKHLSYSDLQSQVRELARRMNILTEMVTISVESDAIPKFNFSDKIATLDVPNFDSIIKENDALRKQNEKLLDVIKNT